MEARQVGMAFFLICVVWLSWGLGYPMTAIALSGFDVMTLRVVVQAIGALALLGQALFAGRHLAIRREAWPDLVISGLLNMAILPLCMNLGVYLMSPGRASVLVYTMPIWAVLFARWILGEPLTWYRIAGLFLGAAGVAVMSSQDLSQLRDAPLGAALTIVGAVSYGLGTVWLKRRAWHADPSVVAFWQLAIGTVPIIAVWGAISVPPDLSRPGPPEWAALAFIGVVGNGLAYFAWFRVVQLLPAGISAISALFVPCVGIASSALLTGERFHAPDLIAMGLIAAALVMSLAERFAGRAPAPFALDAIRQSLARSRLGRNPEEGK